MYNNSINYFCTNFWLVGMSNILIIKTNSNKTYIMESGKIVNGCL